MSKIDRKEYFHNWQVKNREKCREYVRKYRLKHPNKIKARNKKIRENRPNSEYMRKRGYEHQQKINLNRKLREIFKKTGIKDLDMIRCHSRNSEGRFC